MLFFAASSILAVSVTDLADDGRLSSLNVETQVFKKIGGKELKIWIVKPVDWKADDKRPAIVWIHGGAWVSGDGSGFVPHCRYFASRGMVAFSIDYRLLAGKIGSDEFRNGPTLSDCIADCRSAMRWIRANAPMLGIDPDRIAAAGDSAGGHLAACLGTIDSFNNDGDDLKISAMANAVIACNPITDLTGKWKQYVHEKDSSEATIGMARQLSPLFNIRKDLPPEIVMHGTDDGTVLPEDSSRFVEALKAAGNKAELILYQGARHAFIVTGYTASDFEIARALKDTDKFLCSLGWLEAGPTIEEFTKQPRQKALCSLKASEFEEGKTKGVTLENVKVVDDSDRGKSFQFDGKGKIVIELDAGSGDFPSYSMFVRTSKKAGTLLRRDHRFGGTLQFGKDKKLTLSSVRFNLVDESVLPDDKWTEVTTSIGPENITIKSGEKPATAVNSSHQSIKGNKIVIGENFTGLLDEIRIYNHPQDLK